MSQPLTPPPLSKVKLADFDPGYVGSGWTKETAEQRLKENAVALADLAYRLYAEDRRSVLLVLQGMDTSGKDGTIRKVTAGVNPMSFDITSFKQPSTEELDHDYLWRIHRAEPNYGQIGIFNRSHYEDVLVARVHGLVDQATVERRYEHINAFEKLLADGGTRILKFYLHISKDEQKERFADRIADPDKHWKIGPYDLAERKRWDEYMAAFEAALTATNTTWAPWHVVPSNRKWYRNVAIAETLVAALEEMDPRYPAPEVDVSKLVLE